MFSRFGEEFSNFFPKKRARSSKNVFYGRRSSFAPVSHDDD